MADIILVEEQLAQYNTQTLDLILKSAVVGAILYIGWNALVKEKIVQRTTPMDFARGASKWIGSRVRERGGL